MVRALPVLLALAMLLPMVPATAAAASCPPADCPALQPTPKVPFLEGGLNLTRFAATLHAVGEMATTNLTLEVANPTQAAVEGTLTFPMPGGATLLGFDLQADGHLLKGQVRETEQAVHDYEQAKSQGKDAVLLRQASDRRLSLQLNVPPGSSRILSARYVEWLDLAGGQRIYRLPLAELPATVGRVDVDASVEGQALQASTPRLPLALRTDQGGLVAFTHLVSPGPLQDLVLAWGAPSGWTASLLASSNSGAGTVGAVVCLAGATPLAKDVVFVLDRSGSMAGPKIEEARASLRAVLPTLLPGDAYDVVAFDDRLEPLHGHLQAVSAAGIAADDAALANLRERAGTDLDSGLQSALAELGGASSTRLPMIVLLTDGLPTVGVTDHEQIIQRFVAANARHARLHVVPIGLDADYTFLADLALRSAGTFTPMDPADGALAARLERLYGIVGNAVVRDVQMGFEGLTVSDVRPRMLPDLAPDRCVRVLGRADRDPAATVTLHLTGQGADGPVTMDFPFTPDQVRVDPAVGALWGRAQVDELLAQERAGNATRDEVIAAAVSSSQLSPYTSWVIVDTTPAPPPTQAPDGGAAGSPANAWGSSTGTATRAAYGIPVSNVAHNVGGAAGAVGVSTSTPGPGLLALGVALLAGAWAVRRRAPGR